LTQKRITTDYFSIYFGKNLSRENNNKLNISFVMKKKIGSSVIRNKIKRRLRSAVQKRLKNKKFININYSYIIFGKSKTFTDKYSIISDELDKTFSKINQINNQNEVH
jgi:ribonuclease P protein component